MELALFHDWETTGLTLHPDADPLKTPRAIEFGGVLMSLEDGSIVDELGLLINPLRPIEPIITKITGLTNEVLAQHPPFVDLLPTIRAFYARAVGIAAHNLPFDKAIMSGELVRLGITDFPWPRRELCTVGVYQSAWGKNPKLVDLYAKVMGRPLAQTHRALDDVHAMCEIVQKDRLWELI